MEEVVTTQSDGLKILLIEDSATLTRFVEKALSSHGHTIVKSVTRGQDAIDFVQSNAADIALVDVHINGNLDGLETVAMMQEIQDIPVVFVTGDSSLKTVEAIKKATPYGFLNKPFTKHDLRSAVELASLRASLDRNVRDSEARYRLLAENMQDVLWIFEFDCGFSFFSPSMESLIGTVPVLDDPQIAASVIHPSDWARVQKAISTAIQNAKNNLNETTPLHYRLRHVDGHWIDVEDRIKVILDDLGNKKSLVGVIRDVSERIQFEQALRESENRFDLAVACSEDGIWDWNVIENEIYFSSRWKQMLGYSDDQIVNTWEAWQGLIHNNDLDHFERMVQQFVARPNGLFEIEYRLLDNEGQYRWVLCRAQAVADAAGTASRIVGIQRDITDQKVRNPVTGLPNEIYFRERVQAAIQKPKNTKSVFAVFGIEIDNLTSVVNSFGQESRDALFIEFTSRLSEVSEIWEQQWKIETTIAAASDFKVYLLLEHLEDPTIVPILAAQIGEQCTNPVRLSTHTVQSSISIGIFVGQPRSGNVNDALTGTTTALHLAQAKGPGKIEVFNIEMRKSALTNLQLSTELFSALEAGDVYLVYQPIHNLQTQRLAGFEALVRWQHRELGFISPVDFIPLAESSGMMVRLGSALLAKSCAQVRQWIDDGIFVPGLFMSVNVSAIQLYDRNFVSVVADLLEEYRISPRTIKLEVTESSLMGDVSTARQVLRQLADLGVQLSIDDFGTGYSSLSYLQEFRMDYLKIDKSFVDKINSDDNSSDGAILLRTVLGLSHNLGLQAIAEGIESDNQRALLASLGCDYGQGYLFAKPLLPEDAVNYIRSSS